MSQERAVIHEAARDIPVIADVDVAVVGGGTAGVMAAVGAARAGARTCLIERFAVLGGALSMGIVGAFHNRWRDQGGRDFVAGAPREFLARLVAARGTGYATLDEALTRTGIAFRQDYAADVALQMVTEAGVTLHLLATFCDAARLAGGGYALIIERKDGRRAIRARQVVDCSSEADVASRAGGEMLTEDTRSWGLLFNMDHVDAARHEEFLRNCRPDCPEFTPWLAQRLGWTVAQVKEDWYWKGWLDGDFKPFLFRREIMKAVDAGDLTLIRDLPGGGQVRYGWDSFVTHPWRGPDKAGANVCMITGLNPGCGEHVTRAEVAARTYAFEFLEFLRKYIPGFERAEIEAMGAQTMPRGGRTIVGERTMVREDFYSGRIDAEAICIGTMRPENPESAVIGMPLGMFVPKKADDLLVAGKCASGGYALRAAVACMSAGFSCGIVAACAAKCGVTPWRLDRGAMRQALSAAGVLFAPVKGRTPSGVRTDLIEPDAEDMRKTLRRLS